MTRRPRTCSGGPVGGEVGDGAAGGGHIGEDGVLRFPIEVISGGGGVLGETGESGVFPDDDEAGGIAVGQGAEEQGVDAGEDGGIGADAECERKHRDGGERGGLTQEAGAVAQIAGEGHVEDTPRVGKGYGSVSSSCGCSLRALSAHLTTSLVHIQ